MRQARALGPLPLGQARGVQIVGATTVRVTVTVTVTRTATTAQLQVERLKVAATFRDPSN
jgi:hypothetical protein